jgi:hypothetical protein
MRRPTRELAVAFVTLGFPRRDIIAASRLRCKVSPKIFEHEGEKIVAVPLATAMGVRYCPNQAPHSSALLIGD